LSTAAAAIEHLRTQLRASAGPMRIVGGNTKSFYGRHVEGVPLSTAELRSVVAYEPSELVITALAGTPLSEVEAVLAERGQMLAFEPPHFGAAATLGGTIACGFSGPRRPYAGSARDFMLGVRCLTANGEELRFGGQVMKNVAGYDVSRLMVGSLGTLAIITEVSLKVLPLPETEATIRMEMPVTAAIERMNAMAGKPLPLSAAAYCDDTLWLRFSGAAAAVAAACREMGGEIVTGETEFWMQLREHRLEFFQEAGALWRISVPPAAMHLPLQGDWLIDWGGAQRWLHTPLDANEIRSTARLAGGHATLFRGGDCAGEIFTPLDRTSMRIHRELKLRFDPARRLNAGIMYTDL
jgi:glycolate oxidase FAD binding subunit